MFSSLEFPHAEELKDFVANARSSLKHSMAVLAYPDALKERKNNDLWKAKYREIDALNKEILSSVSNRAGVYAIFTAHPNEDWSLKYIGQTKASTSKQRIRSHVVWRNKNTESGKYTGSQFDNVASSVSRKIDIAISFVEIDPAMLRHYVEEALIAKAQPPWNFQGTTAKSQKMNAKHCSL